MIHQLHVKDFLGFDSPIIDVRSPLEFDESKVQNAISIPLLDNEQRKAIGIEYRKQGKESAIQLGFKLINPLKEKIISDLLSKVEQKKIRLYCARGGLRSHYMSSFLSEHGFEVYVLKGGYKSYRQFILNEIAEFKNLVILSGYTGSGKTEVLKSLNDLGEQVLDLEQIANHKGSAFGALGHNEQPSSSEFHNMIYDVIKSFDPQLPVWVENESVTLGKVFLPKSLWEVMKLSWGYEISVPIGDRINNILNQYGHFEKRSLKNSLIKLTKRLGSEDTLKLCGLIDEGNLLPVVERLILYYDKAYDMGRHKRNCHNFVKLSFDKLDVLKIAAFLHDQQRNCSIKIN